jgi:FkbM family methyltransferase
MIDSAFKSLITLGAPFVGRRNLVRLGRYLSAQGRLDVPNSMFSNGEEIVRAYVVSLAATRSASVVLDVGANVGHWTQALAKSLRERSAQSEIYCFEPCRGTFEVLSNNLRNWGLSNVSPENIALSDVAGEADFYSVGATQGRNSLISIVDAPATAIERVRVETMDAWAERHGVRHVMMVKIDTEGNDVRVLRGAARLLAAGEIELAQFEYNHRWIPGRSFLKDVFDFLGPLGYEIGKLTPHGVEHYDTWDFELETFVEGNYLAAKPQHFAALPQVKWWKR